MIDERLKEKIKKILDENATINLWNNKTRAELTSKLLKEIQGEEYDDPRDWAEDPIKEEVETDVELNTLAEELEKEAELVVEDYKNKPGEDEVDVVQVHQNSPELEEEKDDDKSSGLKKLSKKVTKSNKKSLRSIKKRTKKKSTK